MRASFPKLPIIALVSQQRSGTNVFRYMLRSCGDVRDLGDIFHGDAIGDTNFWGFLAKQIGVNRSFACPHYWYDAWDSYLQDQYNKLGHHPFILDLKIDYFRYILTQNPPHAFKPDRYFFFDVSNIKFIYLERQNTAAQVVSRLRAETTGDWGIPLEYEVPIRERLRVEPELLEKQIDAMKLSNSFGLDIIEQFDPLRLTYESLFNADGTFSEPVLKSVGDYTGLDWTKFNRSPLLRKQSATGFMDQVENKTEIVEYFKGSPYESMFATKARRRRAAPPKESTSGRKTTAAAKPKAPSRRAPSKATRVGKK